MLVAKHMGVDCSYANGGQKHLPVPSTYDEKGYVAQPLDILVMVKDPYATLYSLFEYAQTVKFKHFDCGRSWEEFLTNRFVIHFRTDPAMPAYRFRNPIDYWNSFYFNMLSIGDHPHLIIRYEDLLSDPAAAFSEIERQFPWAVVTEPLSELPECEVKRMGLALPDDPLTSKEFARRDWYLSREYMDQYTLAQREFVSRELDQEVVRKLGYTASPATGDIEFPSGLKVVKTDDGCHVLVSFVLEDGLTRHLALPPDGADMLRRELGNATPADA